MKTLAKIFFIIIFWANISYSFDIETASKIYDKLFYAIFQKEEIFVYTDNAEYKKVINSSKYLKQKESLEQSEITIITNDKEMKIVGDKKLSFSTEINIFEMNDNVVGAFYWKMGRPQILFSKDRLKKYNLKLSKSFEKYAK